MDNKKTQKILPLKRYKEDKVKTEKKSFLDITVHNVGGEEISKTILPKEIFDVKVSDVLLALYVRVYLANQRRGTQSVKTRAEVIGSTRKIYRQKGTGRARHGSRKAPIFVGGGFAHAPKPRDYSLKMNKKQKTKTLYGALSQKAKEGKITIIEGLLDIKPKTKQMIEILKKVSLDQKKRLLLIAPLKNTHALQSASRNIREIEYISVRSLNAYTILKCSQLIFAKEALSEFPQKTIL